MPIASKVKKSLLDFYDTNDSNVYDDYGDDFEADSDKDSSLDGGKEDKYTREKKYFERESTNNTDKSALFKKRKEQSFASTVDYKNSNRHTYSQSLTPRGKPSGRRSEKTRSVTGSTMKRGTIHTSPRQRSDGVIVKRVLSANRNKVNALQNLILELQNENEQLRLENRDLKRSSRIQEKAIKKFDNEEAEIPFLIQKHNSEVRVLREKLKRQKDGMERSQDEIRKKDMEIQRLRDKVKRYEELIKEKQLDDRDRLQQKLLKLENDLNEKELKVSELERVVKLGEKARIREGKEKNEKYKKAVEELKRLENTQKDLEYRFKEKEKELEVQNIYSQRIALKKKMNKSQSKQSPFPSNGLNSSRLSKAESPLALEMSESPRERADAQINENAKEGNDSEPIETGQVETMVSALRKKEEELEKILDEERKRRQFEEDQRMLKEMEEKIRRKEEEIKQAEREREDRRKEEERFKEETRRLEEENRKMALNSERELAERKFLERMGREKEDNLKAIKRLENEAANGTKVVGGDVKEIMNKFETEYEKKRTLLSDDGEDKKAKELTDKKELLLARLKAIDDNGNSDKPDGVDYDYSNNFKNANQSKAHTKAKTKPIFLESSRKDDEPIKHAPLDFRFNSGKRRGSKEYNFKSTDENLHKGLPSHPDLAGDAKEKQKTGDDIMFGEYSPTVNSAGRKRASRFRKPEKGDEKEDFLFFDTKAKTKNEEPEKQQDSKGGNDIFLTSRNRTKSLSEDERQVTGSNKNQIKVDQGSKNSAGAGNVFGAYQPTFGNTGRENTDPLSPENDPFAEAGPKYGRRGKATKPTADEGIFETGLSNTRTGVTGLFKDAESKADNFGMTAVKAVSSFADDDIEEMVLT